MNTAPRVTVLLPVHNGGPFLKAAIESILAQTFRDFELLVIDDGSTDDSCRQATAFADPRVRLIKQQAKRGLAATLNQGVVLARGEYLARMDADDISLPSRLQRQIALLDANPAIGLCGSWLEAFSATSRVVWPAPEGHEEIHARLLFESALYHPTVIMRKSLLDRHALRYAEDFAQAQDYELWSRCALCFRLANLGEVLLHYRLHDNSVGGRESGPQQQAADTVRHRWLQQIGLQPSGAEIALHRCISLGQIEPSEIFVQQAHDWLLKIRQANAASQVFPQAALSRELASRWFLVCNRAVALGWTVFRGYRRSPLSVMYPGKKREVTALAMKCLLRRARG